MFELILRVIVRIVLLRQDVKTFQDTVYNERRKYREPPERSPGFLRRTKRTNPRNPDLHYLTPFYAPLGHARKSGGRGAFFSACIYVLILLLVLVFVIFRARAS